MPKKFFTDKDIEELHHKGIKSLQMNDDVVLTDLAYEKAKRLGIQLLYDHADNPPAAPVRPYLSDKEPPHASRKPIVAPVSQAVSQPNSALTPALSQGERGNATDIEKRIRSAVIARLGNQVDAKLLDNIIHRVVKAMGLK
jgi:hypothetical protein